MCEGEERVDAALANGWVFEWLSLRRTGGTTDPFLYIAISQRKIEYFWEHSVGKNTLNLNSSTKEVLLGLIERIVRSSRQRHSWLFYVRAKKSKWALWQFTWAKERKKVSPIPSFDRVCNNKQRPILCPTIYWSWRWKSRSRWCANHQLRCKVLCVQERQEKTTAATIDPNHEMYFLDLMKGMLKRPIYQGLSVWMFAPANNTAPWPSGFQALCAYMTLFWFYSSKAGLQGNRSVE